MNASLMFYFVWLSVEMCKSCTRFNPCMIMQALCMRLTDIFWALCSNFVTLSIKSEYDIV